MTTLTKNTDPVRNQTPTSCTLAVDSDTAGEKLYAAVRTSAPYQMTDQVIIREGRLGAVWTGVVESAVGENLFNANGFDATQPFYYAFAQENWVEPIWSPNVDGLTELSAVNFSEGGLIKCYDDFTFRLRWEATELPSNVPSVSDIFLLSSGASSTSTTARVIVRHNAGNLGVRISNQVQVNVPWTWTIGEEFDLVVRMDGPELQVIWKGQTHVTPAPEGTIGRVEWVIIPGEYPLIARGLSITNAVVPDSELGGLP